MVACFEEDFELNVTLAISEVIHIFLISVEAVAFAVVVVSGVGSTCYNLV
jgi:hypothetical protein